MNKFLFIFLLIPTLAMAEDLPSCPPTNKYCPQAALPKKAAPLSVPGISEMNKPFDDQLLQLQQMKNNLLNSPPKK